MAGFAFRRRPTSAYPSRGSWPHSELHRGPQWQGPHGGPAPISSHPSRGSCPVHRRYESFGPLRASTDATQNESSSKPKRVRLALKMKAWTESPFRHSTDKASTCVLDEVLGGIVISTLSRKGFDFNFGGRLRRNRNFDFEPEIFDFGRHRFFRKFQAKSPFRLRQPAWHFKSHIH